MARPAALPSQQPAVLVEKRGPETVMLGQPIGYEIVVRNIGPVPVFQVRVEDEQPAPCEQDREEYQRRPDQDGRMPLFFSILASKPLKRPWLAAVIAIAARRKAVTCTSTFMRSMRRALKSG